MPTTRKEQSMSATQEELRIRLQDELKRIEDLEKALSRGQSTDKNATDIARPAQSVSPYLPSSIAMRIMDALADQRGINGTKGVQITMPTAAKVVRNKCHIYFSDYGFKKAKQLFDYLIAQGQIVYGGLDQGQQPLISVKEKARLNVPECNDTTSHSETEESSSNWFDGIDVTFLEDLATIAMPEPWSLPSDKTRYTILSNYLRNTFTRLWSQQRIAINEAAHLAVLDTGLLHVSSFEPIYTLFEYEHSSGNRWHPHGFCCAGVGTLGKKLLSSFSNIPARASYFDGDDSPIFDSNATIQVDFDHLLSAKNLSRLPSSFLRHLLPSDEYLLDSWQTRYKTEEMSSSSYYEYLAQTFTADDTFSKRFRAAISGSLMETRHRISADYRMATPMWNPRQPNHIHFLLPLYLTHSSTPDVALIVRRANRSAYQGLTLLPLEQSYLDARLISRLDGSWLNCIFQHSYGLY